MSQASTCSRILTPGPTPNAAEQWKSDVFVKSQNPFLMSSALPVTKFKEKAMLESAAI